MEWVVANLKTGVRRATLNGRNYLVAPLTMIVPGVLNGSQGRLYYPPDEVAKFPDSWNGIPIVVGHPLVNGQHVSGRSPSVLEEYGIGTVFAANFSNKLRSEGWFDEERTKSYDKRNGSDIYGMLTRGQPFELSTGLYTTNEPSTGTAPNGAQYDFIARNYRPDHLAVLLGQKGACSLADGCGVLVNGETYPIREAFDLVNLTIGDTISQEVVGGKPLWKVTQNAASGQPRSQVTGYYKRLGAGTGKGPTHEAAQSGAVALSDEDMKLGADAARQYTESGENPASWVADHAKWSRAKEAAKSYAGQGPETFYSVVTHIYKNMGGKIKGSDSGSPTPVKNEDTFMDRNATISWLVTNCDCWKGDADTLTKFSDDKLTKLKTNAEKAQQTELVANAAREGFNTLYGANLTTNAEVPEAFKKKMTEKEAVEEEEKKKKEEAAKVATTNARQTQQVDVSAQVRNYLQSLTPQQWLDLAPADVKSGVATAMEITRTERENLLNRITTNVIGDEAKKAMRSIYNQLDNTQLRVVANAIPAAPQSPFISQQQPDPFSNFLGAGAPPPSAVTGNNDPGEILDIPTLNFADIVDEQRGISRNQRLAASGT